MRTIPFQSTALQAFSRPAFALYGMQSSFSIHPVSVSQRPSPSRRNPRFENPSRFTKSSPSSHAQRSASARPLKPKNHPKNEL